MRPSESVINVSHGMSMRSRLIQLHTSRSCWPHWQRKTEAVRKLKFRLLPRMSQIQNIWRTAPSKFNQLFFDQTTACLARRAPETEPSTDIYFQGCIMDNTSATQRTAHSQTFISLQHHPIQTISSRNWR